MTHENDSASVSEICAHVKRMGYAASSRVRLYGEDFDVLSDPFPDGGGVAVQAKAQKDSRIRVLQLPTTLTLGVHRPGRRAA